MFGVLKYWIEIPEPKYKYSSGLIDKWDSSRKESSIIFFFSF